MYPSLDDLILLDHYFDRSKIAEQTGLNYQTLSSKINRKKKGKNPKLSKIEKERLREFCIDIHDKLILILNTDN